MHREQLVLFICSLSDEGFPDRSTGKKSACNAGDTGLILVLERSAEEGIGYPLQYSWAFLVAQLVKNPPAMWETWVQSLGCEDSLEKGETTHSSTLAYTVHGVAKSWMQLRNFHSLDVKNLLSLIRSHLLIIVSISITLEDESKKVSCNLC